MSQRFQRRFVEHGYLEQRVDLGEIEMNYAETGDRTKPAVVLVPGQSESWWGYEDAMRLLEKDFHVFAVDVRGQGRSSWTPGRYSFDTFGGDLVRFLDLVVGRPAVVSGNSSGGVLSAWLSAYSKPRQVRGAMLEDPPLFSGELAPAFGPSQRQSSGPVLELWRRYIGDQWSIGDWSGFVEAAERSPSVLAQAMGQFKQPLQSFLEYDPEWSRAFLDGTMAGTVRHETLLPAVKTPVLLTHHARSIDPDTGSLTGAMSELQADKAIELLQLSGHPVAMQSYPDAQHAMHASDPERFSGALRAWANLLSHA